MARPKGSKNNKQANHQQPPTSMAEQHALVNPVLEEGTPLSMEDIDTQVLVQEEQAVELDKVVMSSEQPIVEPSKTHTEAQEEEKATVDTPEEKSASESNTEASGEVVHNIVIKGARLTDVLEKVSHAAYCGAILNPKKRPNLKLLPYYVHLQIDEDNKKDYDNLQPLAYEDGVDYNSVVVMSVDVVRFMKDFVAVAEKGVIVAPKTIATNSNGVFKVKLLTKAPIERSATVKVSAKEREYSLEDLHSLKMGDLRIIANNLYIDNLPGNKHMAVKVINEKQKAIAEKLKGV